jgi:hypothetical protein
MSDAGVIARVVVRMKVRERLYVMLYSAALEDQLKRLYEAGKRRVAAYVDVGGSTFKIMTAVVKKTEDTTCTPCRRRNTSSQTTTT